MEPVTEAPIRPLACLFLRLPEPGVAKTRLAADLGPDDAAKLYAAMAEWIAERLAFGAGGDYDLRLCHAGGSGDAIAQWLFPGGLPRGVDTQPQPDGGLGERLAHAAAAAAAEGRPAIAFLGSDGPDIHSDDLVRAFQRLVLGARAVLGPANDGGFWILALECAPGGLFDGVPWSTPGTAEAMAARLREAGLAPEPAPMRVDVDTLGDLDALPSGVARELARRARRAGVRGWPRGA